MSTGNLKVNISLTDEAQQFVLNCQKEGMEIKDAVALLVQKANTGKLSIVFDAPNAESEDG